MLVTGTGGPAGVTVLQSLEGHADLVSADIDPVAVGLYLVPADRRVLLPRGDDPRFVATLLETAVHYGAGSSSRRWTASSEESRLPRRTSRTRAWPCWSSRLDPRTCLDKGRLVAHCAGTRARAEDQATRTETSTTICGLRQPFIVKPRDGCRRPWVALLDSRRGPAVAELPIDGSLLARSTSPGPNTRSTCSAARRGTSLRPSRAVATRSTQGSPLPDERSHDAAAEQFGRAVAECHRGDRCRQRSGEDAADGGTALLEVNARFPGTMALTQAPASTCRCSRPVQVRRAAARLDRFQRGRRGAALGRGRRPNRGVPRDAAAMP